MKMFKIERPTCGCGNTSDPDQMVIVMDHIQRNRN